MSLSHCQMEQRASNATRHVSCAVPLSRFPYRGVTGEAPATSSENSGDTPSRHASGLRPEEDFVVPGALEVLRRRSLGIGIEKQPDNA